MPKNKRPPQNPPKAFSKFVNLLQQPSTGISPSFKEKSLNDSKTLAKSWSNASIFSNPTKPSGRGKSCLSSNEEETPRRPQTKNRGRQPSCTKRKRKSSSSSSDSDSSPHRVKRESPQLNLQPPPRSQSSSSDSGSSSSSEADADWPAPKIVRVTSASKPSNSKMAKPVADSDSDDENDLNLRQNDRKNKPNFNVEKKIIPASKKSSDRKPAYSSNSEIVQSTPEVNYKSKISSNNPGQIQINLNVPTLSSHQEPLLFPTKSSSKKHPSSKQKSSNLSGSTSKNTISNNKSVLQGIDIRLRFSPKDNSASSYSSTESENNNETIEPANQHPIPLSPLSSTWSHPPSAPVSENKEFIRLKTKLAQFSKLTPTPTETSNSDSGPDSDDDLLEKLVAAKKLQGRAKWLRKPVIKTSNNSAPDSDVEIISMNDGSKTTDSDIEVITINDDIKTPKKRNQPLKVFDPVLIQTLQDGQILPETEIENCDLPSPNSSCPPNDPLSTEEMQDFVENQEDLLSAQELEDFIQKQAKLKFVCKICKRRFKEKTELTYHIRRHNNEKPFVCGVDNCKKAFIRNAELLKHTRLQHPDPTIPVPIFQCKICDKRYKNNRNLGLHVKTHFEKTNFCDICGKAFSQPWYLKLHKTMHDKQKACPCPLCDDSFIKQTDLQKHMKRFHRTEIAPKEKCKFYTKQQRKMAFLALESHVGIVLQKQNDEEIPQSENVILSTSSQTQSSDKATVQNEA